MNILFAIIDLILIVVAAMFLIRFIRGKYTPSRWTVMFLFLSFIFWFFIFAIINLALAGG